MSAYMDVPVPNMCRPKHQILILKTYPKFQKNAVEIKPNGSELSYLLYYVSTRRSKLQKVGTFLERRTSRDVYKRRTGNVQVTLEICRALIEKCPRDLNLYAWNILTILKTVIASKDIALIEETLPCWGAFCSHHDGANLASDEFYLRLFEEVIRLYAHLGSAADAGHEFRWRLASLKAVRSVCSSEALSSANAKQQLAIVIPVILQNIYSEDEEHLEEMQYRITTIETNEEKGPNAPGMPRASIATIDGAMANTPADVDKLDQQDIEVMALQSLKAIFEVNNPAQIRFATHALLQYITVKPNVAEAWTTSLIEMVAKWAPTQSRFLILVEILETLVACPMAEAELQKQLVYAQLLSWLLSSTVNLVGLSVMDVLIAIIAKILQLLQLETKPSPPSSPKTTEKPPPSANATPSLTTAAIFAITATITEVVKSPSSTRKDLLHKLRKCIADLGNHIYYTDQISDVAGEVLLRLKPSPSAPITTDPAIAGAVPNIVEQPHVDDFFSFDTARAVALKSVRDLLTIANQRSSAQSIGRNTVPLSVWEGTHWLLREEEKGVRKAYIDSISTYLSLEVDRPNATSDIATALIEVNSLNLTHRAMKLVNSSFLKLLHVSAFETVLAHAGRPVDVVGIYKLLDLLVRKMGLPAILSGLPMIYRLDEEAGTVGNVAEKIAIKSLVLAYIFSISDTWAIEPLRQDTLNLIEERQAAGKWFVPLKVPRDEDQVIDVFDEKHVYPETIAEGVLLPREDYMDIAELVMHAISTESETEFPAKIREMFMDGATWSKETVMAGIEAHSSRQTSLAESRAGGLGGTHATNTTIRSFLPVNGDRRSTHTSGRDTFHRSPSRPGSRPPTGNLEKFKMGQEERFGRTNRSNTNVSGTRTSSSRESTLRANELKLVLTGVSRSRPTTQNGNIKFNRGSMGAQSDSSDSMMDVGSYIGSSSDDNSTHAGKESPIFPSTGIAKRKNSTRSRSKERTGASPIPGSDAEEEKPPVPPLPGFVQPQLQVHMPGEYPQTPLTPPAQQIPGQPQNAVENGTAATPKKDDGLSAFSFWDESAPAATQSKEMTVTTSPTGAPQIALPLSSSPPRGGTPPKAWWEPGAQSQYSPPSVKPTVEIRRTPEPPASPTTAAAAAARSLSANNNRSAGGTPIGSVLSSNAGSPTPGAVRIQQGGSPGGQSPVGTSGLDVKSLLSGIGSVRGKAPATGGRQRSGSTLSAGGFRPPY